MDGMRFRLRRRILFFVLWSARRERGKAPHGQMADSHAQSVGGVQRPVGLADVEQALDHKGHLFLFRPACAHQGLFDQVGS